MYKRVCAMLKDQRVMGTIHGQNEEGRYMRGNIRTCSNNGSIK